MHTKWYSGVNKSKGSFKKFIYCVKQTLRFSAVLFGYIVVGTLAFSNWEGWSYLDGAYFCFISLMTVGFGDFVPGNSYIYTTVADDDSWDEPNAQLILGTVYILLGMAIIAMCFNLMQQKVVQGVRSMGRKIGIIKD